MCLFNLLKEVEKLGYEILTYEEAREELGIEPLENDEVFTTYQFCYNRYFIFNIEKSKNILNKGLKLFLKKYKKKNNIIKFEKRNAL